MVESRAWDGSDERLYELQEKINRYVDFVRGGDLTKQYPHLAGKPVRLELRYETSPDLRTATFIAKLRGPLEKEGLAFRADKIRPRSLG
jgi:hypothetical protein